MNHAGQGFLLRHRAPLTLLGNLAIATAAFVLAFALRFDLWIPPRALPVLLATLPLLLACKAAAFWSQGLFTESWRHVSIRDVEDIVRGNVLGTALFLAAMVFLRGLAGFPRAVFLLDLLLCTTFLAGSRLAIRLGRERRDRPALRPIETLALIVGAGESGIRLLQEIESRRRLKRAVVGFVDDDPGLRGRRLNGVRVVGGTANIEPVLERSHPDMVFVTIPNAPKDRLDAIVRACEGREITCRFVQRDTDVDPRVILGATLS